MAIDIRCRFGCAHPVGIFWIPEGCACWPDPVQALCEQHFVKVQSDGPVVLIMALGEYACGRESVAGPAESGRSAEGVLPGLDSASWMDKIERDSGGAG